MSQERAVVILGASDQDNRYSYRAQLLLTEHGFRVVPVHPSLESVEGIPVVHDLADVDPEPDVLTIYVRPETSSELAEKILMLRPHAVIFNPGTENPELESRLSDAETRVVRACTIVLLTTGRFGEIIGI